MTDAEKEAFIIVARISRELGYAMAMIDEAKSMLCRWCSTKVLGCDQDKEARNWIESVEKM